MLTTELDGRLYGMVSDGSVGESDVSLEAGDTVTWFAVPEDGDLDALVRYAHGVTGVTSSYSVTDQDAVTSLAYATSASENTLIAVRIRPLSGI